MLSRLGWRMTSLGGAETKNADPPGWYRSDLQPPAYHWTILSSELSTLESYSLEDLPRVLSEPCVGMGVSPEYFARMYAPYLSARLELCL